MVVVALEPQIDVVRGTDQLRRTHRGEETTTERPVGRRRPVIDVKPIVVAVLSQLELGKVDVYDLKRWRIGLGVVGQRRPHRDRVG